MFELINMLSIGILWYQPYRVIQLIGPHLGVLGDLRSQNDGITSWLRLTATSTLLPESIEDIYKVFEHIDMLSVSIRQHIYTVIPIVLGLLASDFGVLGEEEQY